MTPINELLFTVLGSLVGNRVYPLVASTAVGVNSYIVHSDITSGRDTDLDGAGDDMTCRTRKQIDCYAATNAAAKALANQVRTAMDAATTFAATEMPGSGGEAYEPDTKLHRVILDFSVWQE